MEISEFLCAFRPPANCGHSMLCPYIFHPSVLSSPLPQERGLGGEALFLPLSPWRGGRG